VWALYALALFYQVAKYGVNLPKWDEWTNIVPVIDGQRPMSFGWLWTPQFGHRLALPLLVQVGLLRVSGDNFRAGMFFNAACLVVASFVVLLALRRARGGRTELADVTVPVLLLSWTHFDNVLWPFQSQYLLAALFVCILLAVILAHGARMGRTAALAALVPLLLLPISGFNGLIFVPPAAIWLACIPRLRGESSRGISAAGDRAALIGAGGAALAFAAVCLADPRSSTVSQVQISAIVRTLFLYLAMSFGIAGMPSGEHASHAGRIADVLPLIVGVGVVLFSACRTRKPALPVQAGAAALWLLFALAAVTKLNGPLHALSGSVLPGAATLLGLTGVVVLVRVARRDPAERVTAVGLLALLTSGILMAAAVAVARATGDVPARYATLGMIPLVILYVILDRYSRERGAALARMALVAIVIALAPINFSRSHGSLPKLASDGHALESAIRSGMSVSRLVAQPFTFYTHHAFVLLDDLPRLKAAGIVPYRYLQDDPPPQDQQEIPASLAVCDGAAALPGGMFTATRDGGTVTFPLRAPLLSPLVRVEYDYPTVHRGAPTASLTLRQAADHRLIAPGNSVLAYNDWIPTMQCDLLCTTDTAVDAVVITLPRAGVTLHVTRITVWRE
jgi:hypothetical protein